MTAYFSSDTHYYHKNIISYVGRPFESIQEMNEFMIKTHNSIVKPEDTWYFLGDFAFCSKKWAVEVLSRLNGKKIAIQGNHDPDLTKYGFDFCAKEMVINVGGHRVRLSHFPYRPSQIEKSFGYDHRHLELMPVRIEGEFLLHGHSHSNKASKLQEYSLDVGVDGNDFKPYSEHEIASIIQKCKKM